MQQFKNWFHDLSVNIVGTMIYCAAVAALSFLASIFPNIKNLFFGDLIKILLTFSLIIIGFFLFIFIFKHVKFYCVYVDKKKIEFNYELFEFKFEIIDKFKSKSSFHIIYKSKNDTSSFPIKIGWTGSDCHIKSQTEGAECIKNTCASESNKWSLELPRKYRKNEIIDINYCITLLDENQTSIPFLQYNVNQPTKRLVMTVSFPEEATLDCLTMQCYIARTAYIKESSDGDTKKREFTYEPKSPKLLDRYRIEWKMKR